MLVKPDPTFRRQTPFNNPRSHTAKTTICSEFLTTSSFENALNLIFSLFVLRSARKLFLQLRGRSIFGTIVEINNKIRSYLFGLFLRVPAVRAKVQKEITDATVKLQPKLATSGPSITRYLDLPSKGWSSETILTSTCPAADSDLSAMNSG